MTSPPDSLTLLNNIDGWLANLREYGLRTETEVSLAQSVLTQSRHERLDLPSDPLLVIMLCGPTAVGKSSLINAIAGAEISRAGLGATTSSAVIYIHANDDPGRLFEFGADIGQLAHKPHTVERHERAELLHKVLIDTPDIDSVKRDHGELTAALVHAADLVLFVTTPERYKDMLAAHWVRDQSPRRAMAFILNKWDRESVGLQWDNRTVIEEDLKRVLSHNGFNAPIVFKTSCLGDKPDGGDAAENQISDLRDWLERRFDISASAALQDRRRVAAWGRLADAIARVVPEPVDGNAWLASASQTLAAVRQEMRVSVKSAVLATADDFGDRSVWPQTPGLFGIYARFISWCSDLGMRIRGWGQGTHGRQSAVSDLREIDPAATHFPSSDDFGASTARIVTEGVRKLNLEAKSRLLPAGPVAKQWAEIVSEISARLASLPSQTWVDLCTEINRPSLRRIAGIGAMWGVEALILAVLGVMAWRIGSGFYVAQYVTSDLLYHTAALVVVLLIFGHFLSNMFFPSLKRRFQSRLTERMDMVVDHACDKIENALRNHVKAIVELEQQGHTIQRSIDQLVESLKKSMSSAAIDELFGQPAPKVTQGKPTEKEAPPARRRATFE